MAGQLPVTGVTVGDQSGFGFASVANAARALEPAGIAPGRVASTAFAYYSTDNGVGVSFEFTQSYAEPPAQNVPFVFDGSYLATAVSAGDTSRFGSASVVNSAQSFTPTGWDSAALGRTIVWSYVDGAGVSVDFPFTDGYSTPPALNTPFYFGGQLVASGLTLGAQGAVGGVNKIQTVAQVTPSGIASKTAFGRARVGDQGNLNFLFTDAYTQPPPLNVPFYFGGTIVATPSAGDTSAYGKATVLNLAQALTVSGIDSQRFGRTFAYYSDDTGYGVDFLFVQEYTKPSTLNVPFYFAGVININVAPISDGEFGTADVQNRIRYVTVPGTNTSAYGTPTIGRYVVASGFGGEAFGTPSAIDAAVFYKYVDVYGFTSTDYGVATVYNVSNDGFGKIPPGDAGTPSISYRITLQGIDSAVYGKPGVSPQFVRPTGWIGAIGAVVFSQTLTSRTITVGGFSSYAMGSGLKVDPRFIYPPSFVATSDQARFGNLRVGRNAIEPLGIPPSDFGLPKVGETKQYVTISGIAPPVEQVSLPQVIGRWEYVRPSSVVESGIFGDSSVRNVVRYVLSEGFDASYFPPYQPEVYNKNRQVLPYGWVSPGALTSVPNVYNAARQLIQLNPSGPETFGPDTGVGELNRTIYPTTIVGSAYGTAVIANTARVIDLNGGGITGMVGTHLVAPARRVVDLAGLGTDGFAAGTGHSVQYLTQFLRNVGNIKADAYGTAKVESTIRTISLSTYGIAPPAFGGTTVWFKVRYVAPPSVWPYTFDWEQTGRYGRVEYAIKYVAPFGWDSLTFGTTAVARNEVAVSPPSIVGGVGVPNVEWSRRYITPRTVEHFTEWGTAWVSTSPRYVQQVFDDISQQFVGGVGVPPSVENRNKTITGYGWQSSRFSSGNFINNNARVLEQKGLDQAEYGTTFVSFRIRTVYQQSWESSAVSGWTRVYNLTRIIEAIGIPRLHVGVPYVYSNTQWLYPAGSDNLRWGDAMVADAIRTISLSAPAGGVVSYGIAPPNVPQTHYVGLFRQFVAPPGIAPLGVGGQHFQVRFNIIRTWGVDHAVYGEPSVRNGTPEVRPLSWIELEMSPRHAVGLYTRTVSSTGIAPPHEFLPRPVVEYRTKIIAPRGIDSLRMSNLNDVRIDQPQIPAAQLVEPPGYAPGEPPAHPGFGAPAIQSSPFPEGWQSSRFGSATVRLQGCYPVWDYPSSVFGTPTIPRAKVLTGVCVRREGDPYNTIPQTDWGKPRLTPHTIWARLDTPDQAVTNHPESKPFREIDNIEYGRGPDVQWGNASVTLRTRAVAHYHLSYGQGDRTIGEVFGAPSVQNKKRQLLLTGIEPGLFGIPELPSVIEIYVGNEVFTVFGQHTLTGLLPPYNGPVLPSGMSLTKLGTPSVQLKNRVIYPVGTRMDVFGNNYPMVHFPRKVTNAGGSDLSTWGSAKVEFLIRQIFPQGTDMFVSDYDVMTFDQRMRVFKKTHPTTIGVGDTSAFGTASTRLKVQVVRPYQIPAAKCFGHDVAVEHLEEVV